MTPARRGVHSVHVAHAGRPAVPSEATRVDQGRGAGEQLLEDVETTLHLGRTRHELKPLRLDHQGALPDSWNTSLFGFDALAEMIWL